MLGVFCAMSMCEALRQKPGKAGRLKANKGMAGVDGRDIPETAHYLQTAWPEMKFVDRVHHDILMGRLRKLYAKLHLTVSEAKSAVAGVFGRNFLGSVSRWHRKARSNARWRRSRWRSASSRSGR
jgi:hypothetical protein